MQLKESGAALFKSAKAGSVDPPPEDAVSELTMALRRSNGELNCPGCSGSQGWDRRLSGDAEN